MKNNILHKLGIDIGSTTVKIAILDENNNLLFSDYERHFANIRETLHALIKKALETLQYQCSYHRLRRSDTCKACKHPVCTGGYRCIHSIAAFCSSDRCRYRIRR